MTSPLLSFSPSVASHLFLWCEAWVQVVGETYASFPLHRLIINDCLDSGTQLPFIKRAMSVSVYYVYYPSTLLQIHPLF